MAAELLDIQAQIKAQLEIQKQTVEAPTGNKISLKGKQFTLPDGTTSAGPLRAVILDYRTVRQYYKGVYNQNDPKPPVCFAVSKLAEGVVPSDKSEEAQCGSCDDCSFNEWGSAPTGKGKACKNSMLLAVVPEGADADSPIMTVSVSPTGLKSFNAMISKMTTSGFMPAQMVVEMSFNPNEQYPQLIFKADNMHDQLDVIWPIREAAQAILDRDITGS